MSDELEPEIERILNMSDDEVEAELRAEGIDPVSTLTRRGHRVRPLPPRRGALVK